MKKIFSLTVLLIIFGGCEWAEKAKQSAEETIDATTQVYEDTKNKVNETVDDVEKVYDSSKAAIESVDQAQEDVQAVFD